MKASTEGKGCGGGIRIEGRAGGREGWVGRRERYRIRRTRQSLPPL